MYSYRRMGISIDIPLGRSPRWNAGSQVGNRNLALEEVIPPQTMEPLLFNAQYCFSKIFCMGLAA